MTKITKAPFGTLQTGGAVAAYTLENENGMRVCILDYGGTVQSIVVPDRGGAPTDVALGYHDIAGYERGTSYFGAFVGRYANRIGNAAFELNGKTYRLPKNDGENHLHGAFSRRILEASVSGSALTLRYVSPDGEDGFPGTVEAAVMYTLTEDNALAIEYRAVTDADTFINLTNHTYFNLAGRGDILSHRLYLHASRFTEVGAGTLPTGRILPVAGAALDLRRERTLCEGLSSNDPQLLLCRGYDHNFILDPVPYPAPCGGAWCEETGIAMELSTTQPGVQLYTGNYVDEDAAPCGKGGARYPRHGGFCLETQHFPDSPNHPEFPSTLLRPGEEYRERTQYRFFIR